LLKKKNNSTLDNERGALKEDFYQCKEKCVCENEKHAKLLNTMSVFYVTIS